MIKYLLFLFSLLILTIVAVNLNVSKTAASKVAGINYRHNQKELFKDQRLKYDGYIENAQLKMRLAVLLVAVSIISLCIGRPPNLTDIKWHLPFLIFVLSWIFIVAGYEMLMSWSDKMFYIGDVSYESPSGYLYTDVFSCYAICKPGAYFETFWLIKIILLVVAAAFQFFLSKKKKAKYTGLFITLTILDILIGNLVLVFLHDNVDTLHKIFNFFLNTG